MKYLTLFLKVEQKIDLLFIVQDHFGQGIKLGWRISLFLKNKIFFGALNKHQLQPLILHLQRLWFLCKSSTIPSQFSYSPLIWMFCSRKSNNLINKIHERSLKIVTNDKNSTFEDLLKSNNQITVPQWNLQV